MSATGPTTLPGWVLRAMIALSALGVAAILAANGVAVVVLGIFALVAFAATAMPASLAPALLIGCAALVMAVTAGDPLRPGVLALVVLLHLVHVTSALAALVPLRSRLHLAALRAPARRFAFVQLFVLMIAGALALLPNGRTTPVVEILALGCAVGLALAVMLVTRPRT
jgi:hypothetical protein